MIFRPLLFVVLGFSLACSHPAFAQEGTEHYPFTSRSQVVPALVKTRGNLRATYEVLICAARRGYSRTSLGYYENLVVGKEFSATPKDSAAYSFAYDLCDGPGQWFWKVDTDPNAVKKSSRVTAQYFRERAEHMGSSSPEILLLTSFHDLYQGDMAGRALSYHRLQMVSKRAPKWSDAYFWLGVSAGTYGMSLQTRLVRGEVDASTKIKYPNDIKHLGAVAMTAFDKAEKLDPGLKPYLFLERLIACEQMGTKRSAALMPVYAEAHLKAFPNFGAWYQKQWGKGADRWMQTQMDIAAEVLKHATS